MTNTKPAWFKEFEDKNDSRWDRQEKFNKEISKNISNIKDRITNIVVKNNLKE